MSDTSPWARRAPPPPRLAPPFMPGWVLIPVLAAVFAAQMFRLPDMGLGWALSGEAIREGRWETLFTHMFLHGGVAHIGFNAMALLSLQRPVVAELGRGPGGLLWFLLLYLASGLAGAAGYLALHWDTAVPVVGASGAICGLWGAASRMGYGGRILPLRDRQVWLNLRNFTLMNLILIAIFALPQLLGGSGEVQSFIAWEAHVGGYLLGLIAIPFVQRLSGWREPPPPGPWIEAGLSVPPTRR